MSDNRAGEPSDALRQRVEVVRAIQRQPFAGTTSQINSDIGPGEIQKYCDM